MSKSSLDMQVSLNNQSIWRLEYNFRLINLSQSSDIVNIFKLNYRNNCSFVKDNEKWRKEEKQKSYTRVRTHPQIVLKLISSRRKLAQSLDQARIIRTVLVVMERGNIGRLLWSGVTRNEWQGLEIGEQSWIGRGFNYKTKSRDLSPSSLFL